jgi:hypothetical protein
MPTYPAAHLRYLDLARRLLSTVVVGVDLTPVVVYRGEHGLSSDIIHSRSRAVSFGTFQAASSYALSPNRPQDKPIAPRVMAAYLSIKNPALDNRDDPFIEMSTIVEKLGPEKAELIARRFAGHIENTGNWVDGLARDFESVEQLLDLEPARITDLYLDAYPVFDDDEVVSWFAEAGYDGAIHLGNGETALEEEYKVFDRSQVHLAFGVDHAALAHALTLVRAENRLQAAPSAGEISSNDLILRKDTNMAESSLLKFQSNYRGQVDYLVLTGPLAGKRVSYRYMKPEFYEMDYADYGARAWAGDPDSYRREVLASVGLVCCSSALVPHEIVDEMNRLAEGWREHDPEISTQPARAGVYVHGHGWTEAADVVLQYGDHLERFTSIAAAEQWLCQPTRTRPDQAWEEGRGGEIVRDFAAVVAGNRISLVEPIDDAAEPEEDVATAPAY